LNILRSIIKDPIIIDENEILWKWTQNKVAGQNPEVSTGIEIETHRNPSKPAIETHRNPSKPIETCQNRKVSTFAKMGLGFCPATLEYILLNKIQYISVCIYK